MYFRQSQLIEKGFKKTENCEQNVALLLFLFTLEKVVGEKNATYPQTPCFITDKIITLYFPAKFALERVMLNTDQ